MSLESFSKSAPPPAREEKRAKSWIKGFRAAEKSLKLRHRFKLDQRTTMELGMDFPLVNNEHLSAADSRPWASLLWQLDYTGGEDQGAIELTPEVVTLNKDWTARVKSFEVPVTTKIGLTHTGDPHVDVKVHKLAVVLPLAALLLFLRRPINLTRSEVGTIALDVPVTSSRGATFGHTLFPKAELSARLSRGEDTPLQLEWQSVSALLRLVRNDTAAEIKAAET